MHKGAAMNLYEKMKSGIYVIAEMSANHAGKIENAFKIIEEAAKASADCVKIQTYTADTLTIDCDDSKYVIIRICPQLYFSDTLFS
jgi:pseudaminic acid synthase